MLTFFIVTAILFSICDTAVLYILCAVSGVADLHNEGINLYPKVTLSLVRKTICLKLPSPIRV